MAKQQGILPISGRVGNFRFFKGRNGNYHVSQHSTSLNKARLLTDENFERTRENMSEFATVAKAAKLLREATLKLVANVSNSDMSLRLRSLLFKVIKTDTTHPRGSRIVGDGDLNMLTGFEFGKPGTFKSSFSGQYSSVVDRPNGDVTLSIPAFTPKLEVKAPQTATHIQFHAGILELNFETGMNKLEIVSGNKIPWDNNEVAQIDLRASVAPGTTNPVVILAGIEYWLETNGQYYQIKDQGYNSAIVAAVSQV